MCKLFYIHCKDGKCGCKYFHDEPQYCDAVKQTFTKKTSSSKQPAGIPNWVPILSMARSGLGRSCDVTMETYPNGPVVRFQDKDYFRPVRCNHIECLEQGTEESCPLHTEPLMGIKISDIMISAAAKRSDDRERARREGGGKSKGRKIKDVVKAIIYAV